jgi:hypothetical protein
LIELWAKAEAERMGRLDDAAAKRGARNSTNAAGPRKPVTRQDLEKFRDEFVRRNAAARGWITAACLEFPIDRKTLKTRLKE